MSSTLHSLQSNINLITEPSLKEAQESVYRAVCEYFFGYLVSEKDYSRLIININYLDKRHSRQKIIFTKDNNQFI